MIPIEDVERLSRAYRKQTAMALKEAKAGSDKPTRVSPAGLIPVLERTGGVTIMPMKLLELWQGWAKHRGLEPHPVGAITEPPAAFVADVLTLIQSEQERGRRMNVETEQLASRDFWCEWGALFAWARRHSSGHGISELFTGMINRTGPTRTQACSVTRQALTTCRGARAETPSVLRDYLNGRGTGWRIANREN